MPILDAAACASLMDELTAISARAAMAIGEAGTAGVRSKPDGTPVTAADEAAQAVIAAGLSRLAPGLRVISEELPQDQRQPGDDRLSYFLVDPLDGTREFIAGREEYTINIAVMTNGAPILGVITAPALRQIWRGIVGLGAERLAIGADGAATPASAIHIRPRPPLPFVVMVSRSHLDDRTQAYLAALPGVRITPCGSSLKFCRIAEGSADLYPRLAPTHDWDLAAGHALLCAAGGRVVTPEGGQLRYGTAELLIPAFIASGGDSSTNPTALSRPSRSTS